MAKKMARKASPQPVIDVVESKTISLTLNKITNNFTKKGGKQIGEIADELRKKFPAFLIQTTMQETKTIQKAGGSKYCFVGEITATYTPYKGEAEKSVDHRLLKFLAVTALFGNSKNRNWAVAGAKLGKEKLNIEEALKVDIHSGIPTAEIILPDDWEPFFEDIYGLEPQIRLTIDPIVSFVKSGYRRKNHICMYGQPGCGKTTLCKRLYEIISRLSPPGACLELTASQMTKAGLETMLIECDPKPSLIFIEEIDKAIEENCTALLDVCNTFGAIKKTDARRGNVNLPINAIVVCTINDIPKFKRMLSGALASRFAHKIFFPRPKRDTLRNIGLREMLEMKGNERYVDKVLEIMDREHTNDPRRLKALLDGGERLMTGSYQKDQEKMRQQLVEENQQMRDWRSHQEKYLAQYDLED